MRVLTSAVGICLLSIVAAIVVRSGARSAPSSPSLHAHQPETKGVIMGVVADGTGAPMRGVTVDLRRDDAAVATTHTNASGGFAFERVAPGMYEVRATFRALVPAALRIVVGDLPNPPLRLSLGIALSPDGDAHPYVWLSQPGSGGAGGGVSGVVGGIPGGVSAPAGSLSASHDKPETMSVQMSPAPPMIGGALDFNTATYDRIDDNRFRRVGDEPLSTFSIDVDTASYSNVRRFLNQGTLPPADAVRTEELINYFRFDYPDPDGDAPFSVTAEVAACPWSPRHRLALIGLQAKHVDRDTTPARNLVFLLDVSGSMMPPDRLPLVQTAMRMLVDTLTARDRVAIVVYAGASGLVLPSTPGDARSDIHRAIRDLRAGGSTNGAAGIQLAYDTAASSFINNGVNRVILATDGDFNIGVTSQGELVRLIEQQRARGIFLSVLGVGTDNLKDSTMEKLADKGNGNYAYLDSLQEARRVLIETAGATLVTVAKDVKIQVEFNPRAVSAYRLVGYENRLLNREDFNDDTKDAGEIGAGHSVTALYELIPAGEPVDGPAVDPLKYQETSRPTTASQSGELLTVKLRYKKPEADTSRLLSVAVADQGRGLSPLLGFAAAVAEFGMLLRDSQFKGQASWASAQTLARRHRGADPDGYRAELVRLVDVAATLDAQRAKPPLRQPADGGN